MPITYATGLTEAPFEMQDSPVEVVGEDSQSQSVTLRCKWSDRYNLVNQVLYGPTGVEGALGYPYHGAGTASFAATARIQPVQQSKITKDGQGLAYEYAEIEFGFRTAEKADTGGGSFQVFSEEFSPNAEFITLDHKDFRWSSGTGDKLNPEEAPGFLIVGADYTQTWYNVSSIPTSFATKVGSVNNASHVAQLLGFTFPAQTLLFTPPQISRTVKSDGSGSYTLASTFRYKPQGWNKYWRAKTQSWESIFIAGGGVYNSYPLTSFSDILL